MLEKVYSINIHAPIRKVWDEITRAGSVCRPMYDTVMDGQFRAGSPYRYRSQSGKHVFTKGTILEIDPPRRMVQTFQFTNLDEKPSLVTWTLEEVPGPSGGGATMTRVTIVHSQFDGEKTMKGVDGGWPTILGLYKSVCETGTIPLGKRVRAWMMSMMMIMIPKSMSASRHPLGS
ncbi:MAG: SRPBCC domain-containing protein [Phycisphaerales bacterium]